MITNTELEIAIEVIAAKIALYSEKNNAIIDNRMKELLEERNKVYLGDEKTIKKVLYEYGPEVKGDDKK